MEKAYKIVTVCTGPSGRRTYYSGVLGRKGQQYFRTKFAEVKPEMKEYGLGLCVFQDGGKCERFLQSRISNNCTAHREVWIVETSKQENPPTVLCYSVTGIETIKMLLRWASGRGGATSRWGISSTWPEGTLVTDRVKLLKKI